MRIALLRLRSNSAAVCTSRSLSAVRSGPRSPHPALARYGYFATPSRKVHHRGHPVDARQGLTEQSRRHAVILSLLRVPHLVLAVNKMDLVDYDEKVYNQIYEEFTSFATKLNIPDLEIIPVQELEEGYDDPLEASDDELAAPSRLRVTSDPADLDDVNVYIVTTPTPHRRAQASGPAPCPYCDTHDWKGAEPRRPRDLRVDRLSGRATEEDCDLKSVLPSDAVDLRV